MYVYSIYTHKVPQHVRKRALCIQKRAIYIYVYIHIQSTIIRERRTIVVILRNNMSAKEPYTPAKEPDISTKEPYTSAKEPDISAKEPYTSAKDPNLHAKEPVSSF